MIGVNKDGGVGAPHSCQYRGSQDGVQEGRVDGLHLHLVGVAGLDKVSDPFRHGGAQTVQRGGD